MSSPRTSRRRAPPGTVKKGEVVRAVVVRTSSRSGATTVRYLRFDNNAIVIIDKDLEPARHPYFRTGRPRTARKNFMKIVSLAPEVLMNRIKHPCQKRRPGRGHLRQPQGFDRQDPAGARAKERVLIEGVRMIKKHLRKSQDNPSGRDHRAGGSDSYLERESGRAWREGQEEQN